MKDKITYEIKRRRVQLLNLQANKKVLKILKKGIKVEDLYPGKFVYIETLEWLDDNNRKVKLTDGVCGIFVKLLTWKEGGVYIYFAPDPSQDALLCDNPESFAVRNRFVEIYDNSGLLQALKELKVVTADFCRTNNEENAVADIFSDEKPE